MKFKENLARLLSSGNKKNILLFISIIKNNNISDSDFYEICKLSYDYKNLIIDGKYDIRLNFYFSNIKEMVNNYGKVIS